MTILEQETEVLERMRKHRDEAYDRGDLRRAKYLNDSIRRKMRRIMALEGKAV